MSNPDARPSSSESRKGAAPGQDALPDGDDRPKSRKELVEEAAYRRFRARGADGGGNELQDWLDAEAEVDAASRPAG